MCVLETIFVCAFQYSYLLNPPIFCAFFDCALFYAYFQWRAFLCQFKRVIFWLCVLKCISLWLGAISNAIFDSAFMNTFFSFCIFIRILRNNFDCAFLNAQLDFFWKAYPYLCNLVCIPIIPVSNSIRWSLLCILECMIFDLGYLRRFSQLLHVQTHMKNIYLVNKGKKKMSVIGTRPHPVCTCSNNSVD